MNESRVFRHSIRYASFRCINCDLAYFLTSGLNIRQYFEGYAKQTPKPAVDVKIRKTFEEFSTDPETVAQLKRLYKTPDDVDFVVGVQL
jgi:peroxidase